MNISIYNSAVFLLSAAELEQLPEDSGNEIAFIGRSNSGKSSAINAITGIKGLARASKTPGRTQLINIFKLTDKDRLVDLPGYGYAKAPIALSKRWHERVNEYLETRRCLRGLVLLMDIRHPLKKQDVQLLEWAIHCELPVHILLTKADKLKRGAALNTLQEVQKFFGKNRKLVTIQLFSAHEHVGIEDLHQKLDIWLASN